MPDISVMRGSVLLGGFNRGNKEKKIGTFIVIVHPLLLGFHSDSVRSSIIRGVYSQEFVENEVKKSWSWSYKIILLVILPVQIEEFNYRLLIMLK